MLRDSCKCMLVWICACCKHQVLACLPIRTQAVTRLQLRADWQAAKHLMLAACTHPDKPATCNNMTATNITATRPSHVCSCVRIGEQAST